jgi:hypothetical protein
MVQHYNIFDFQSFPLTLGKDIYHNNLYFVCFHAIYSPSSDYENGKRVLMALENMTRI